MHYLVLPNILDTMAHNKIIMLVFLCVLVMCMLCHIAHLLHVMLLRMFSC